MTNTTQAAIEHHLSMTTGRFRLVTILCGIRLEARCPGMRLTAKAPKCSTILRKEFGLRGKPDKLAAQFEELLSAYGVL